MSDPIRDQSNLLREALGPTPECPPLELLAAPHQEDRVKQHLAECPHCRTELALLHQFESPEAEPGEAADLAWVESELALRSPAHAPGRATLGGRVRAWVEFLLSSAGRGRLALATAALLVLVAAGVLLRPGPGMRPMRAEEDMVWRSGQLAATSPIGDLEEAPKQLRWEAAAGAASYHVRLLEVDGAEIWSGDSAATTIDFPSSLAPKLIPGRAFEWSVEAHDAVGRRIAATNLQSFHIVATQH